MKILISLIFALLLFPATILADIYSDIVQRVDSDIGINYEFVELLESEQYSSEELFNIIQTNIPRWRQYHNASAVFYQSKLSEASEQDQLVIRKIITSVEGMSSSLNTLNSAIPSGDKDLYLASIEQYDRHINSLNSSIKELESNYGVVDYEPWLALLFWVTLVISATLFLMSRGSPVLPAEQLRNEFEFALFKASLWPFAGATISYFWLLLTPPGGTFYMLWGIIGIGFFQFFRGLYEYLRYSRPAINLAKRGEQKKLESLIRSEEFQEESLSEKAQEIGKLKPVISIGDKHKETEGS